MVADGDRRAPLAVGIGAAISLAYGRVLWLVRVPRGWRRGEEGQEAGSPAEQAGDGARMCGYPAGRRGLKPAG